MGELVAGQPALQLDVRVSLPLDFGATLSLMYRAVPGSGLDPWLVTARRSLTGSLRYDLDLLHGFSGRLLYYLEEPFMRFDPLRDDRAAASARDFFGFLEGLPAESYRSMAINAIQRVRRDQDLDPTPPHGTGNVISEEIAWRQFIEPGLTTATADEVVPLLLDPAHLRSRTIGLFRSVWETVYQDEYARRQPELQSAVERAKPAVERGFGLAFSDLTGSRVPVTLLAGMNEISRITFCPSAHLGAFVSYVRYPPDMVIFFGLDAFTERITASGRSSSVGRGDDQSQVVGDGNESLRLTSTIPDGPDFHDAIPEHALTGDALLDVVKALGDDTRLHILDLLHDRERYAQEIVADLGIAQSAVSRHLSQLERAGLVRVRPQGGMKYYSQNGGRIAEIAQTLVRRYPESAAG